jgi:hypothetical protein
LPQTHSPNFCAAIEVHASFDAPSAPCHPSFWPSTGQIRLTRPFSCAAYPTYALGVVSSLDFVRTFIAD